MKGKIVLFLGLLAIGALQLRAAQDPQPIKQYEPHDFLLLGLQLNPSAQGLANRWVVSEGGDFALFGPLQGGYEIGKIF